MMRTKNKTKEKRGTKIKGKILDRLKSKRLIFIGTKIIFKLFFLINSSDYVH